MKRVRCPRCEQYITFDETKYSEGQALVFECPYCGKQFGIRIGTAKLKKTQDEANPDEEAQEEGMPWGAIIIVENDYCYKQVIPLHEGDNVIGRHMKGNNINCPIETGDLVMDMTHCVINVGHDKRGGIKYVLRDGPSNHGTFINGERMNPRERRNIEPGTVFNIGVTSVILKGKEE